MERRVQLVAGGGDSGDETTHPAALATAVDGSRQDKTREEQRILSCRRIFCLHLPRLGKPAFSMSGTR
jgi:hypothetical protein